MHDLALERPSRIFGAPADRARPVRSFREHLPVDAERGGLLGRQRMAELLAELLQTVVIGLAELVVLDFGIADLGKVGGRSRGKYR